MIYAKTKGLCQSCEDGMCGKCIYNERHKILNFISCSSTVLAVMLINDRIESYPLGDLYNVKEEPDLPIIRPFKNPVPLAEDEDWISV